MPSFYFSIWLHVVALNRIFMGPNWNLFYGFDVEQCKNNWWLNLLLMHNNIKTDEIVSNFFFIKMSRLFLGFQCITSSWYVSCDFHYFVLAVLLILALRKNEKIGYYLLGVVLVLSTAAPGLTTYFRKLDIVFMHWYE